METSKTPPRSVIRRLSKYLLLVRSSRDDAVEWIRSHELADALGLTSATVRRDLSCLEFHGTPKRGYRTDLLEEVLENFLGADEKHKVILIGAGNLGKALVAHRGFRRHGFHIVGVYDHDPQVIGTCIGDMLVKDFEAVNADSHSLGVSFGILAVPAEAAQGVADQLVAAGFSGILNLSLAHISAPSEVTVVDTQIVAGLQELACVARIQPDS